MKSKHDVVSLEMSLVQEKIQKEKRHRVQRKILIQKWISLRVAMLQRANQISRNLCRTRILVLFSGRARNCVEITRQEQKTTCRLLLACTNDTQHLPIFRSEYILL